MRVKKVEISDEVADVLRRGTWRREGLFVLPPGQLDRQLYGRVDAVLRALGGKWNRSERGHLFSREAAGALEAALDQGHVVDQKKTLEQFFTPPALAARMAKLARIEPTDELLEPSAGGGALIRAALDAGARPTAIWAYEIDPALRDRLRSEFASSFGSATPGLSGLGEDFMEAKGEPVFNVVLMNPPFSSNQDIKHVQQAFRRLAPGGRLVAIMSPHFTFANDAPSQAFRELIGYPAPPRSAQLGLDPPSPGIAEASVELLPAGTFKEAGTNIAAVLVTIEKAAS